MKLKKNIKTSLLILIILFAIPLTSSLLDIEIDVRENFDYGEEVFFEYTLISNNFKGEIEFLPHVDCGKENTLKMLKDKTVELQLKSKKSFNYSYGVIDDSYVSAECIASVEVFSPFERLYEGSFIITPRKDYEFSLEFGNRTYKKGDLIVLNYYSDIGEIEIDAKLNYPDEETEIIDLPYEIKADKIGTYELKVTASKEGYKTITKKEQFGVIEKSVEIQDADFSEYEEEFEFGYIFWSFVLFMILIAILIAFFIYKKIKESG